MLQCFVLNWSNKYKNTIIILQLFRLVKKTTQFHED
jgi:hypothetical protein